MHSQLNPWRRLVVFTGLLCVVCFAAFAGAFTQQSTSQPRRFDGEPTKGTPSVDPASLRRLTFEDLTYEGAFRLPANESNGESFSFATAPMTFNPDNKSLFIGTRNRKVAEVSIPEPVKADAIAALPFASYLQPMTDPSDGHLADIATSGVSLSGLLVHDRTLYGAGIIYYDANNIQTDSHFARPLQLSESGVKKLFRVWQNGKSGFVAGYMASVPPEWQEPLGGPALTGQCCLAIITRTSLGPAAFVFDPSEIRGGKNASAEPLLYYPHDHPTLGPWEGANATYGGTTQVGGVALVAGTRSAIFIGRNGLGTFCYGNGTNDPNKASARSTDGQRFCYDPTNADKGQHAFPYRYQMWAYDLAELADVRAGRRDPWSVKPYGVWPFDLPFVEPGVRVGGVAYDPSRQRIFVSQLLADRDGYSFRPLIHVFRIP